MAGLRLMAVFFIITIEQISADFPQLKKEYEVVNKRVTWYEAKTLCERDGMSLATVMSREEQRQLRRALSGATILNCHWIAATNDGCGEDFCWFGDPSTPVTYNNWARGGVTVEVGANLIHNFLTATSPRMCAKVWGRDATWYKTDCSSSIIPCSYVCEHY